MNPKIRCPKCGSARVGGRIVNTNTLEDERNLWTPIRDYFLMCHDCGLSESKLDNEPDFTAFRERWNDVCSEEEYEAQAEHSRRLRDEHERSRTWPDARYETTQEQRRAQIADARAAATDFVTPDGTRDTQILPALPEPSGSLLETLLAAPDDDEPRRACAAWYRSMGGERAERTADFIDAQLDLGVSLRRDPHVDVTHLPPAAFASPTRSDWWRYPSVRATLGRAFKIPSDELQAIGALVDPDRRFRGFPEHVAIKAARFLEIAEELYGYFPIRQLTLTYCKGDDHRDHGLWNALLASPHLRQIRAITFPGKLVDHEYMVLNKLGDDDLAAIAASPNIRGVRYLAFEDQALSATGFTHLAALPNLHHVRHDLFDDRHRFMSQSFGGLGGRERTLREAPLRGWMRAAIEEVVGPMRWLHPRETYGTDEPEVEAVIEYPPR